MRAQIDRKLYKKHLQNELFFNTPNLDIIEAAVEDLVIESHSKNVNNQNVLVCNGVVLSKLFVESEFFFKHIF